MSTSSIIVVSNALRLNAFGKSILAGAIARPAGKASEARTA